MFLVDHDQPDRWQWREDRRAGADHHVDLAGADAVPLVVTGAVRQAAVLHGDPGPEGGAEAGGDGGRQADLGHQDERLASVRHGDRSQPTIDLRLPAPGHPV